MASSGAIRAGQAFVELFTDSRRMSAGLANAGKEFHAWGQRMRGIGLSMTAATGALALPAGIAVKQYSEFGDAIAALGAVTRATPDDMAALTAQAKDLGLTTSYSATQVTGLMSELGKAGFVPTEILGMTEAVVNLARATGTDATLSAGIMSSTIRQFSLDASDATRISDVLTEAANATFSSVEGLGEGLSNSGLVAKSFGYSLEQTVAMLGSLANVGIQGAEGGTTLKRLLSITGAEVTKLEKVFGIAFKDAAGNALPLTKVLDDINQSTAHLGSADKAEKFNEAFGLQGITGATALGTMAMSTEELTAQLSNAGGVAKRTALAMDDTLGGSFRHLMSAVNGTGLALGEALEPELHSVVDTVTGGVKAVAGLVSENKELITTVAIAAAGIGTAGVALAGFGTVLTIAGPAIGALSTTVALLPASLAVIPGLLGGVAGGLSAIALVAGAGVGAFAIYQIGKEAAAAIGPMRSLKETFPGIGTAIRDISEQASEGFGLMRDTANEFASDMNTAFQGVVEAVGSGQLQAAGEIAMAGLNVAWQTGVNELTGVWSVATTFVQDAWNGATGYMKGLGETAFAGISVAFIQMGQGALNVFDMLSDQWDTLVMGFQQGQQIVTQVGNTMVETATGGLVKDAFGSVGDKDAAEKERDLKHAQRLQAQAKRVAEANQRIKDLRENETAGQGGLGVEAGNQNTELQLRQDAALMAAQRAKTDAQDNLNKLARNTADKADELAMTRADAADQKAKDEAQRKKSANEAGQNAKDAGAAEAKALKDEAASSKHSGTDGTMSGLASSMNRGAAMRKAAVVDAKRPGVEYGKHQGITNPFAKTPQELATIKAADEAAAEAKIANDRVVKLATPKRVEAARLANEKAARLKALTPDEQRNQQKAADMGAFMQRQFGDRMMPEIGQLGELPGAPAVGGIASDGSQDLLMRAVELLASIDQRAAVGNVMTA